MSTRIGLVVPSSNTVVEPDFHRCLPEGATLHAARMRLVTTTPEAEAVMLDDHLPTAVTDLASARPDVVVFACTSAGALRGNAYEAELVRQIAAETGGPVVSVAAAVRSAIAARNARRVGVISPYVDALNAKIRESLEAEGYEVVAIHGLGMTENFAIAEVSPEAIVQFAVERFADVPVDLLFVSCTNFRALEAAAEIERALGVPVVTSNQAALEAVRALVPEAGAH